MLKKNILEKERPPVLMKIINRGAINIYNSILLWYIL